MIVLGIDPGLTATGYAVLDVGNGRTRVRASGCAKSPSKHALEARVRSIYDELAAVLAHEEAHRRRCDPLLFLLWRLIGAIWFFYPLTGPLLRRLRDTSEGARAAVRSAGRRTRSRR